MTRESVAVQSLPELRDPGWVVSSSSTWAMTEVIAQGRRGDWPLTDAIRRGACLPNSPGGQTHRSQPRQVHCDQQVTSAYFSASAEQYNIEFGLVVRDPALAQLVQKQLFDLQPLLYQRVPSKENRG